MRVADVAGDRAARAPQRRLPLALDRSAAPLVAEARAIDRAWRPQYAVWEVTLRCDLACHHCSSRAGRARADELTTAEALQLVEQLAELGVLEVTLIGGEVYLRSDWCEIVRAIRCRSTARRPRTTRSADWRAVTRRRSARCTRWRRRASRYRPTRK
jgi:hypothetical protein